MTVDSLSVELTERFFDCMLWANNFYTPKLNIECREMVRSFIFFTFRWIVANGRDNRENAKLRYVRVRVYVHTPCYLVAYYYSMFLTAYLFLYLIHRPVFIRQGSSSTSGELRFSLFITGQTLWCVLSISILPFFFSWWITVSSIFLKFEFRLPA